MRSKRFEYSQQYYKKNKGSILVKKRGYKNTNKQKVNENWRIAGRRRREIKVAFIRRYKMAAGCFDCGYNLHAQALQFDHVLGVKKGNISHMTQKSWPILITETEKCVVRCANCHAVKTHAS